ETKNFIIRVGKGIITPGHVMIIPKHHYKALAEIDNNLVQEYLDLKNLAIEKITQAFHKPFLIEYGVFGQTVFHAHIHIIPKASNQYQEVDLFKDMILPTKTPTIEITNFSELQEYYKQHKEYIYFEDHKKHILPITDTMRQDIRPVGYRHYFAKIGLKSITSWKAMTEEDIKQDELKIKETKEKLKF
ncbi:MAG: HIT family protein, partial [Rickettsiales bacterium]|nr:HIT family protein [Rickettsiales bacterium]